MPRKVARFDVVMFLPLILLVGANSCVSGLNVAAYGEQASAAWLDALGPTDRDKVQTIENQLLGDIAGRLSRYDEPITTSYANYDRAAAMSAAETLADSYLRALLRIGAADAVHRIILSVPPPGRARVGSDRLASQAARILYKTNPDLAAEAAAKRLDKIAAPDWNWNSDDTPAGVHAFLIDLGGARTLESILRNRDAVNAAFFVVKHGANPIISTYRRRLSDLLMQPLVDDKGVPLCPYQGRSLEAKVRFAFALRMVSAPSASAIADAVSKRCLRPFAPREQWDYVEVLQGSEPHSTGISWLFIYRRLTAAPPATKAAYDQLREGMSFEETNRIVGQRGELYKIASSFGSRMSTYRWRNQDGSAMHVAFRNNRLVSKIGVRLP